MIRGILIFNKKWHTGMRLILLEGEHQNKFYSIRSNVTLMMTTRRNLLAVKWHSKHFVSSSAVPQKPLSPPFNWIFGESFTKLLTYSPFDSTQPTSSYNVKVLKHSSTYMLNMLSNSLTLCFPAECIYVLNMILKRNSYYFLKLQ
jgi:hypothetical protein